MTLGEKICWEGLDVCMNFQFNLLHHVGVVAKILRAAAAHKGDDNIRGKNNKPFSHIYYNTCNTASKTCCETCYTKSI